jgi:hypothetical protein
VFSQVAILLRYMDGRHGMLRRVLVNGYF